MSSSEPLTVPGRACGACSLCCKLLGVEELNKPIGKWCPHCQRAQGCSIHQQRPKECRTFYCAWLLRPELGDEWYPLRSKMVPYFEDGGRQIAVHVDPGYPLIWRTELYFAQLKQWARNAFDRGGRVCIYVKNRVTVILPTKEAELGNFEPGDCINVIEKRVLFGRDIEVQKVSPVK